MGLAIISDDPGQRESPPCGCAKDVQKGGTIMHRTSGVSLCRPEIGSGFICWTRWALSAIAIAAALLLVGSIDRARAASTLVLAPDGAYRGKIDTTGTVREFLGMRYAQPVTGTLRWKPPQPVTPVFHTQDATQFGNHCPQAPGAFGNASSTEDCLFLNVFTPNRDFDGLRPVMVWIHGGALVVGESDDYDATKLVQRDVVVVTINYRLGALGFLAHPALSADSPDHISGNYGIEDQQAALRWVRRNIWAFGGNPEKVTIFGESAGGLSTFTNLVSPTAAGLFHRAIVESGAYELTQPTLAQAEPGGVAFANAVGCNQSTPAAVVACLRSLNVATILTNQGLTFVGLGPAPNIDGKVLTQSIQTALGSGQFNRVPLMNGTNHDEWRLFVGLEFDLVGGPVTAGTYPAAIAATIGTSNPGVVAAVAAQYPLTSFTSPDLAVGALGTDAIFACPSHFADQLASPFVPTFAYEFNDENAPQDFLPPVTFPYGAAHASEIQYIFPTHSPTGVGLNLTPTPLTTAQRKLSDQMVGYWTEFAESGNPNAFGQPIWPSFHRSRDVMASLNTPQVTTESNFATVHQCAFWDGLSGRTLPAVQDHEASAGNN
jgi:para-nitrobenzyl esterase